MKRSPKDNCRPGDKRTKINKSKDINEKMEIQNIRSSNTNKTGHSKITKGISTYKLVVSAQG